MTVKLVSSFSCILTVNNKQGHSY